MMEARSRHAGQEESCGDVLVSVAWFHVFKRRRWSRDIVAVTATFDEVGPRGDVHAGTMQVEDGAMVIDINLDDGLLDGVAAMQKFCKIAVTEPDVSRVRRDPSSKR